jgi:DNA modification methylase
MCGDGTLDREKTNLITGDGVAVMDQMPPKRVNVILTSFPYWGGRRTYDPQGRPIGIGFEATWEEYCENLVNNVGRAMKRVLSDDGVLMVVLDDAIAMPSKKYWIQTPDGTGKTEFWTPDSTYLRREGNWLGLPFRYMFAMQDAGWFCRDILIIDKGDQGRKEVSPSRTRHSHEYLLMFTKSAHGYFDHVRRTGTSPGARTREQIAALREQLAARDAEIAARGGKISKIGRMRVLGRTVIGGGNG